MAVLGDKIAGDVRKRITQVASFTGVEAFPQKDNPKKRVFPEAKLSTAVFTVNKRMLGNSPFRCRVHPAQFIEENSPHYQLTTDDIPLYDPINFTIASCSQADWDLAVRLMQTGRLVRLRQYAEFFQGEINETTQRREGVLVGPRQGQLVTRGASVCLYVTRPASQGEDLYLDVDRYLEGKDESTKAFHHRHRRVCWQESSPQNNFRRLIAALIPAGEFCNHKINYLPEHTSQLPLEFVLGLLNSKLADWYFRLGSTNAAVSHYQLYNLPCPVFAGTEARPNGVRRQIRTGRLADALEAMRPFLQAPPFPLAVRDAVIVAVKRIIEIEENRGDIRRIDRSELAPAGQPYQDFIDRLFYAMAGISDQESADLEARLAQMQ